MTVSKPDIEGPPSFLAALFVFGPFNQVKVVKARRILLESPDGKGR